MQPNLEEIRTEQSAVLTEETLEELGDTYMFPWASCALKWGVAEFSVGNIEIGDLLVQLSRCQWPDGLLMRLCHAYICKCFPELHSWPDFAEIAHWAYLEPHVDEDCPIMNAAQDFVALLQEPPKVTAGAKELFADLAKLYVDNKV